MDKPDYPTKNRSGRYSIAAWTVRIAAAFASVTFCLALILLLARADDPLLEAHAFRQTQTAFSVWTTVHGGPVIDYLTPVAGDPWVLPFEAPIYNIVVAGLKLISTLGLDTSGRVCSFAFLLGTIGLGAAIVREVDQNSRFTPLVFASLMFASPQYLVWGQAFLMETCATFFGAAMLYGVVLYLRKPSTWKLLFVLVAATLCALTKTTTWLVFAIACVAFWLTRLAIERRIDWRTTLLLGSVAMLSGASAVAWTSHADALKAGGLFTSELTQAKLLSFHLGGVGIRLSGDFWAHTLPFRILPDALGWIWPAILLCLVWAWRRSRRAFFAASVASLVFFLPMLIVMNAHAVHNYYQTANAIFVIGCAAIVVGGLERGGKPILAIGLLALLVAGQFAQFLTAHLPLIARPLEQEPSYVAAKSAREMTAPGQSLFVFGIDQSSEVHYYAERRGIAFTDTFPLTKVKTALADPGKVLGSFPLGGVVDCRGFGRKPYSEAFDALVTSFVARARMAPDAVVQKPANGCEVIAFSRLE